MPPYSRLIAASAAAASKDANDRTGSPYSTSEESTNATRAPNSCDSTAAAAFDTTLWPLGYSGNGGVCSNSVAAYTCACTAVGAGI